MGFERFDFLVVGSGIAGLAYALHAAKHGTVCVITKGEISESNTQWAQGGIAAAVGEADSWELHEQDTLIAGAGLCDPVAVRFLVQNAPDAIQWLLSLGARFDLNGDELALGREGGHSRNRIVHHADRTGWEVERAVVAAVRADPRIAVYEKTFATALLMADGRCVGLLANQEELGDIRFAGRATMLATGGCGKLYQHTTNPPVATADGIALAHAAGALIKDMEFMQFHPTTLYHPQMRSFLITEAVRGAGGTLRNHNGRRFMFDYDPRLELAPRDVVARAIEAEMKKLETWCVYLDMTHLPATQIQHEFPTIYERLRTIGIQVERDWIPVVPAQHYSCGGIVTDLDGQTSVPGLFASGEVARTGVHGANRLASNSLLEAMVFSIAAAKAGADAPAPTDGEAHPPKVIRESEAIRLRRAMQKSMTENVGIVRDFEGLAETKHLLDALVHEYQELPGAPFARYPSETWSLLIAAQYVVDGAIRRPSNVGLHFNLDLVEGGVPSNVAPETTAEDPLPAT
jgi:L-aspartate oxidase